MSESEQPWINVINKMLESGTIPVQITAAHIEMIKLFVSEEQARFINKTYSDKLFLSIDEIKARTILEDAFLNKMLKDLMYNGILRGLPNEITGMMEYEVVEFYPGFLEYTLIRGESGEKPKKVANLWMRIENETKQRVQGNYDQIVTALKESPPPALSRVIPIEATIEPEEVVLESEDVSKVLEDTDSIGVGVCYCRHKKNLVGEPCKTTKLRHNCFFLGRTAQFAISQGFVKPISLEAAKKIVKTSAEDGLLHKTFYSKSDLNREIEALCNCCSCCCGEISRYHRGVAPITSLTSYMARIDKDKCIGCGICEDECPVNAIQVDNEKALVNEALCIGCGICVSNCPEETIHLERTGIRQVVAPPPRLDLL